MEKQRKVMVLSGAGRAEVEMMFIRKGWIITRDMDEADLLQFTGGADVSPNLYDEYKHPTTSNDPARDSREAEYYYLALAQGIPMAGICRGGQFLNVMNGGGMWQDVDSHAIQGTHEAFILGSLLSVQVSSTHHQMMRPNLSPEASCHVIMTAGLSKQKHKMTETSSPKAMPIMMASNPAHREDIEAVYYGNTNCLCFQPHPEFTGKPYEECCEVYFHFLNNYLFGIEEVVEAA